MILFYITSISDLMVKVLLEKALTHDVFVATPRKEVYDLTLSWGLAALWMTTDILPSRREGDRQFKDDFMPGILDGTDVPDTELPLWQVLSLDRLKFWHRSDVPAEVDFLLSMRFNHAYTSFDMGDPIPFALARKIDVIAVKTEPIRTREVFDLAPWLEFSGYIVDTVHDRKFLDRVGVSGSVELIDMPEREQPKYPAKDTLRESMGLSGDVLGIMFDPRYERQCRKLFEVFQVNRWPTVLMYPISPRAAELLPDCLREYADRFSVVTDYSTLAICDEIVAFAYDENYSQNPPAKMVIYDVHGLNKARELAPEYEVRGLPS